MPFMSNPREYLNYFVEPNYIEFETWPGDARRGLNATISCYHLTDWVRRAKGNHFFGLSNSAPNSDFNVIMDTLHPDLSVLRDLTNGTKHFSSKPSDPVAETVPAALHYGPVQEAIKYGWMPGGSIGPMKPFVKPAHIKVTLDNGSVVELKPMLQSVVKWWPSYLTSIGL